MVHVRRDYWLFGWRAETMTIHTLENTRRPANVFDANGELIPEVVECDTVTGRVQRHLRIDGELVVVAGRLITEVRDFPAPLTVVEPPEDEWKKLEDIFDKDSEEKLYGWLKQFRMDNYFERCVLLLTGAFVGALVATILQAIA